MIQKSWDQHHLKGIVLSYSQNFESHHLHAQINFYLISKFTGTIKITGHFRNKNSHGPDLPETGRNGQIQPRSATPRVGEEFQTADMRGPVVSGCGIPNRYRMIPAVRLSVDLRPVFVILAIEERRGGGARVRRGLTGGSPRAARR
jgi:hypothetical protein